MANQIQPCVVFSKVINLRIDDTQITKKVFEGRTNRKTKASEKTPKLQGELC